jgi:hypothetical protein
MFWLTVLPLVIMLGSIPLALVFVPAFVAIMSVLLLPFGFDLALFGVLLDAEAEVLPVCARLVELEIDPSLAANIVSMRHRIYEFPEARAHLALWINGRIQHQ